MAGIGRLRRHRAPSARTSIQTVTPNSARTAVLFPGQGSQTAGMAAVTAAQRPDLLEQARGELGADPFERIGEGTHFAQPAIYCASLAHWKQAGSPDAARCSPATRSASWRRWSPAAPSTPRRACGWRSSAAA